MTGPDPDITARCAELDERLRKQRITATSPKGVVRVIVNGIGDEAQLLLRPGAKEQYEHDSMGEFMTAAFTAADDAVAALRRQEYGRLTIGDDTLAGHRRNRDSAAAAVADCFGTGNKAAP